MPEAVSVTIDGRRWGAWSGLRIRQAVDEVSTIEFEAPFEPERAEFRQTFEPFTYKPLRVEVGEELVFQGTLVVIDPEADESARKVSCSGYATPGVLQDCTAPASAWPLELNGLRFSDIARTLVEPFGIGVAVEAAEGAAFRRVAADPNQTVWDFLVSLAQQRGLILANTTDGRLRVHRAATSGPPRARLREGAPPLLSVRATLNPQSYFSEVTGRAQTRAGAGGSSYTASNARLSGVLRPHAFSLEDADAGDAPSATTAKLGRMFGQMMAVTLEVPTWRDASGTLWAPGSTVELEAPGAMVYGRTEFVVRAVDFLQDDSAETAELELVLPGVYSGEVPDRLPWEA